MLKWFGLEVSLYLPEDFKKSPSHHVLFCSLGCVVRLFSSPHRTNIIITFYSACQWETVYIFFVISIKFFWMYFRHEELLKKTFSSRNIWQKFIAHAHPFRQGVQWWYGWVDFSRSNLFQKHGPYRKESSYPWSKKDIGAQIQQFKKKDSQRQSRVNLDETIILVVVILIPRDSLWKFAYHHRNELYEAKKTTYIRKEA